MEKFFAIATLAIGETIYIYAELRTAGLVEHANGITLKKLIPSIIVTLIATTLLLYGYYWCYKVFRNIWYATTIAVTSILLMEPIMGFLLFQQMPTFGTGIGFLFGAIGMFVTLIF